MKEDSKRQKKLQDKQKTVNKMAIVSPSFSIITLNLNGLKSSIRYNGKKIASLTSGAGKIGQPLVKE